MNLIVRAFCGFCMIAGSLITVSLFCYLVRQIWWNVTGVYHFAEKAAKEVKMNRLGVYARLLGVLGRSQDWCQRVTGVKIRFLPFFDVSHRDQLGMATGPKWMRVISFSPVWIYLMVAQYDYWETAFYQSVGHEIAHRDDIKRGGIRFFFRPKEERRFFYWLREVRNDFAGVGFAMELGDSRFHIINAMAKKAEWYQKYRKDIPYISHPSWETRIALIREYSYFNDAVVDAVANAAGCTNNAYIAELKHQLLKQHMEKF